MYFASRATTPLTLKKNGRRPLPLEDSGLEVRLISAKTARKLRKKGVYAWWSRKYGSHVREQLPQV